MKYCLECSKELEDFEDDICEDCRNNLASGILFTDGIDPDLEDLC